MRRPGSRATLSGTGKLRGTATARPDNSSRLRNGASRRLTSTVGKASTGATWWLTTSRSAFEKRSTMSASPSRRLSTVRA
jgi:hypothetical protein